MLNERGREKEPVAVVLVGGELKLSNNTSHRRCVQHEPAGSRQRHHRPPMVPEVATLVLSFFLLLLAFNFFSGAGSPRGSRIPEVLVLASGVSGRRESRPRTADGEGRASGSGGEAECGGGGADRQHVRRRGRAAARI